MKKLGKWALVVVVLKVQLVVVVDGKYTSEPAARPPFVQVHG